MRMRMFRYRVFLLLLNVFCWTDKKSNHPANNRYKWVPGANQQNNANPNHGFWSVAVLARQMLNERPTVKMKEKIKKKLKTMVYIV